MLGRLLSLKHLFYPLFVLSVFACPLQADEIFENYPPHLENEMPYRYPTERFIDVYGWERISAGLKSLGVSMVHRNLFDRIWHREERGFLGYHGSTQEYRIYQDIIRMILEEHVNIPIRKDFHFFRIPGDPQYLCQSWKEFDENRHLQTPAHTLCMNYALYGNFHNDTCCSYYYFSDNSSLSYITYEKMLIWLFEKLGIDQDHINEAFEVSRKHLSVENGVLFQVFDMSHFNPWKNYYALADTQCYTFATTSVSETVSGTSPEKFPPQVRLLMSNRHSLNPYSAFVIKRYDGMDPKVCREYENELRNYIKSLKSDQKKVDQYKKELLTFWEVNDEI